MLINKADSRAIPRPEKKDAFFLTHQGGGGVVDLHGCCVVTKLLSIHVDGVHGEHILKQRCESMLLVGDKFVCRWAATTLHQHTVQRTASIACCIELLTNVLYVKGLVSLYNCSTVNKCT